MNTELKEVLDTAIKWQPVGSRVTCNPPPENTDYDYLVLVGDNAMEFIDSMTTYGFDVELGEGYAEDALNSGEDNRFQSYRADDINIIATVDPVFYERFVAGTTVAKRLNLMNKGERIDLFQAVLYGNRCDADIGQANYRPVTALDLSDPAASVAAAKSTIPQPAPPVPPPAPWMPPSVDDLDLPT